MTSCLPLGLTLGAVLGRFLTPYIGWRGLFAVGLLPALLTLLIRSVTLRRTRGDARDWRRPEEPSTRGFPDSCNTVSPISIFGARRHTY